MAATLSSVSLTFDTVVPDDCITPPTASTSGWARSMVVVVAAMARWYSCSNACTTGPCFSSSDGIEPTTLVARSTPSSARRTSGMAMMSYQSASTCQLAKSGRRLAQKKLRS